MVQLFSVCLVAYLAQFLEITAIDTCLSKSHHAVMVVGYRCRDNEYLTKLARFIFAEVLIMPI